MDIAKIRKASVRSVPEFGLFVLPLSIEAALLFETMNGDDVTTQDRVAAMMPHIRAKLCNEDGKPLEPAEIDTILEVIGFAGFHRLLEAMTEAAAMTESALAESEGN